MIAIMPSCLAACPRACVARFCRPCGNSSQSATFHQQHVATRITVHRHMATARLRVAVRVYVRGVPCVVWNQLVSQTSRLVSANAPAVAISFTEPVWPVILKGSRSRTFYILSRPRVPARPGTIGYNPQERCPYSNVQSKCGSR